MQHSESLKTLIPALSKAQAAFKPLLKQSDGQVGNKQYKYADLAAVMDAVREPLSKNGLAFIQAYDVSSDGTFLETRLIHESGEWIASVSPVVAAANCKPQDFGSASTYARRYALIALLGIAAEDDDGAAAQQAGAGNTRRGPDKEAPKQQAKAGASRDEIRDTAETWVKTNAAKVKKLSGVDELAGFMSDADVQKKVSWLKGNFFDLYDQFQNAVQEVEAKQEAAQ